MYRRVNIIASRAGDTGPRNGNLTRSSHDRKSRNARWCVSVPLCRSPEISGLAVIKRIVREQRDGRCTVCVYRVILGTSKMRPPRRNRAGDKDVDAPARNCRQEALCGSQAADVLIFRSLFSDEMYLPYWTFFYPLIIILFLQNMRHGANLRQFSASFSKRSVRLITIIKLYVKNW